MCTSYFLCKLSIWMDSNHMKISIFKTKFVVPHNILNILFSLTTFSLYIYIFKVYNKGHSNWELFHTVPLHSIQLFSFLFPIFQFILAQFNQYLFYGYTMPDKAGKDMVELMVTTYVLQEIKNIRRVRKQEVKSCKSICSKDIWCRLGGLYNCFYILTLT